MNSVTGSNLLLAWDDDLGTLPEWLRERPDSTRGASAAPVAPAEQVGGGQALGVGLAGDAVALALHRDGDGPGRVDGQAGAGALVLQHGLGVLVGGDRPGRARLHASPAEGSQQLVVLVLEAQHAHHAAAGHAGERNPRLARVVADRVE